LLFSAIVNVHPWGCPVYILQPLLQDGGKVLYQSGSLSLDRANTWVLPCCTLAP
jgi:hypothetical protein